MEEREQKLRDVPLRKPDPSTWPQGVRSIAIAEADALGVDAHGGLYWHGKPVETRRPLVLTWWQNFFAIVVASVTVFGGLGAAAQGWAAYNDWACKIGWSAAVCPPTAPGPLTTPAAAPPSSSPLAASPSASPQAAPK